MAAMDYRETIRTLQSEGHDATDIDAAIESLIESGIEYADEGELLLTSEEVDVLRAQLTSEQAIEDKAAQVYETATRGPGRPEVGRMVNVRMPEDLIARLDAVAEREHATRAEIIRSMLWQQLYTDRTGI